jgi:hypothetical protein
MKQKNLKRLLICYTIIVILGGGILKGFFKKLNPFGRR